MHAVRMWSRIWSTGITRMLKGRRKEGREDVWRLGKSFFAPRSFEAGFHISRSRASVHLQAFWAHQSTLACCSLLISKQHMEHPHKLWKSTL